jgi:hypothetical protein
MGSRAGYIVKRDGVATAYGSRWGASSIMDEIFWGPDYATEAFTAQEAMDELEEIDGGDEGSVLIDWDAKRMIWWAANCRLPVHQNLFNKLAAHNWPGWQIEAARGYQGEILDYFGIDLYGSEETDDQDEEEYDEEFEDEEECIIEQEMIVRPETPKGPILDLDELQTGVWVTIHGEEEGREDYFVAEYDDADILQAGPQWFDTLPRDRSLGTPAPELVTVSGVVVDCPEKTIWRWRGSRYAGTEQQLKKIWPDYRFRDIADGWLGQVKITGRSPGTLQADERQILGWVVASLLGDASIDPRKMISNVVGVAKGVRVGCLAITLLVGVVGGGLAFWLNSVGAIVVVAILFALCLVATLKVWRKSAAAISILDMPSSRDNFHKGLTTEEKRPIMSQTLASAGFPSLEELEKAGELPDLYGYEDDEEEEE